ncbi:MAG: PASTA domain-containing protein [Clostridiaceae bacterium]
MKFKSLTIVIFTLVTIGFLFGFVSYNKKINDALSKEIVQADINEDPHEVDLTPETPIIVPVETSVETPIEAPETPVNSGMVVVPALFGLTKETAKLKLEELGLVPDPEVETTTEVDGGIVFWQTPYKGIEIKKGTKVSYSVAAEDTVETPVTNIGTAKIPDVIGLSEAAAISKIEALGFKADANFERKYNNDYGKGFVYSQNYLVGAEVAKGTVIGLRISLGKQP